MVKVDAYESPAATRFSKVKKFDPQFHGPIKNRSCTDVICLPIFAAFLVGWGYIAVFAYSHGMLERIIYPTDSQGLICGYEDALERPFLFYFDLTKCVGPEVLITGCVLTKSICVEHCPSTTFVYMELLASLNPLTGHVDTSSLICLPDVNKTRLAKYSDVQAAVARGICATYYFPSGPVAGRCLPGFSEGPDGKTATVFDNINTSVTVDNKHITFQDVLNGSTWIKLFIETEQTLQRIAIDIQMSWISIVVGFMASAVLSLIWAVVIRWLACPMLALSAAAMASGLIYGIYYCYNEFARLKILLTTNATLVVTDEQFNRSNPDDYPRNPSFWAIIGAICAVVLVILVLIVTFMRKRIRIAIALIRESSRAIAHMTSTLFFPVLPLILQLATLGACGTCAIWLTATGSVKGTIEDSTDLIVGLRDNDSCDPNNFSLTYPNATGDCKFVKFYQEPYLVFFQLYNAFGFLWGMAFSVSLGHIVLAGTFASYYWAWIKPKDLPAFPIFTSFYRALRYHLGSLAFGSLLVAAVQVVQYTLLHIQRKLKYSDNFVTRFLIKICICCFFCLEKCIKFINRHAYVMMAIFGRNFCVSAKDAFSLLIRNAIRVVIVDSVVSFFLFFGKILILGSVGCFFYYFYAAEIPGLENCAPTLNYIFVPVVIIIIGSYIISSVFFGVYVMAIDTMFFCFLEDLERNDGTPEKPYFMSKSLMNIYGKKNTLTPTQPELSAVDLSVVAVAK